MRLSLGAVMIIVLVLVVSVSLSFFWILLTPRWSFTIATDKADYATGENVQITVTLRNTGYFPQSLTSAVSGPVIVSIEQFGAQAWWAPTDIQIKQTTFTLKLNQSLVRTFIWNGSWWSQERHLGTHTVNAMIPNAQINKISDVGTMENRQFYAYITINITS